LYFDPSIGFGISLIFGLMIFGTFYQERVFIKEHTEIDIDKTDLYKKILLKLKQSEVEKTISVKESHSVASQQLKIEQPFLVYFFKLIAHISKTKALQAILEHISINNNLSINESKKNIVMYRTSGNKPQCLTNTPHILDNDINIVITSLSSQKYFKKVILQDHKES